MLLELVVLLEVLLVARFVEPQLEVLPEVQFVAPFQIEVLQGAQFVVMFQVEVHPEVVQVALLEVKFSLEDHPQPFHHRNAKMMLLQN